ncbi:MAG: heparinase II/III family protein [Verrucomicrobiota bacterium]
MHCSYLQALVAAVFVAVVGPVCADPTWAAAWASQSPPPQEMLLKQTAAETNQTPAELWTAGHGEKVFISAGRPPTEWASWRLAHLYRLTGDGATAERAASLLAGLASRPVPRAPAVIHAEGKLIPFPAAIAFSLLREAPVWRETGASADAAPSRDAVEHWLRGYAAEFLRLMENPDLVTNYTPFGLRHAASLALILRDPVLMQRCDELARRLVYDPEFWHADLIWQEGTVSYARQVTGNLKALMPMLREGGDTGLAKIAPDSLMELEQRIADINAAQAGFAMPGGRPIPVNDTHWTIPPEAVPGVPRNIAYPDFGHYALAGRDVEAHLSAAPLTGGGRYGGGHYHDSRLSLQLWAHGQEVLPDAGYPFQPANNRYFHMSPLAHNVSVAWTGREIESDAPRFGVWGGWWARTAVLGYDPGVASGGEVTYIAASSPGVEEEGITRSERTLIQVATGRWSGYVVDVFWLQGGAAHESYLRQTEEEAVDQTVDAPLLPVGANMARVLGEPETGDKSWRRLLKYPRVVRASGEFKVTWTGESSNVALNIFLAPQPGSTSWLSRMPLLRPTGQNPAKRDDFSGWHLYRRREVKPDDITLWAAVHEPVGNGEQPRVKSVQWERSADGTGVLVRVALDDRTDTWALGLPEHPVEIDGWSLQGRAAGFSTGGNGTWAWAAAGAKLAEAGVVRVDASINAPSRVVALARTETGGRLTVDGAVTMPESGWAALRFADGSGKAVKLAGVESSGAAATVFILGHDAGMEIDDAGMNRTSFPLHSIPGPVELVPLGAAWVRETVAPGE